VSLISMLGGLISRWQTLVSWVRNLYLQVIESLKQLEGHQFTKDGGKRFFKFALVANHHVKAAREDVHY
jgi:hypothetical protein